MYLATKNKIKQQNYSQRLFKVDSMNIMSINEQIFNRLPTKLSQFIALLKNRVFKEDSFF